MRQRTVIDVKTGQMISVPFTPQEEAEADALMAEEQTTKAQEAEDAKDVTKVPKMLKAIALWVGDLHGLTPAQVKAQVKAKYESLP